MPNSTIAIGGGDAVGSESSHTPPQPEERRERRKALLPEPKPDHGQRLEILQDPRTGAWVYVVTDRDTGKIIARLPRDAVADMGDKQSYAAGALIKAKA
jgi:hypothetical protein